MQAGRPPRLADLPTASTLGKAQAREGLERLRPRLADLHERLWSRSAGPVLVILQGMDTSGKDSTIRAVFSGMLPQALEVQAFAVPTVEEARHDFLWRYHQRVPGTGRIGVFNRSWYEGVLIERIDKLVPKPTWRRRYDHINAFESLLTDRGVRLLKVFLHVSRAEQARRLRKRAANPSKAWKHNPDDARKHAQYDEYLAAYEDALAACSPAAAPWHIVPADDKPARNLAVAQLLAKALEDAS